MIEKKLGTKDWEMRINISLVDICIVDTWLAYKTSTGNEETKTKCFLELVEEIIDKTYDQTDSYRKKNQAKTPQTNHDSIIKLVWQDQV